MTFSIEIRPSPLDNNETVLHIRSWPYDADLEYYIPFKSESEAIEKAPEILAKSLNSALKKKEKENENL